ncbi:MAG TPA: hypothetical protein VHM19_18920 [Polyangiales bacterium]|nr:hypothetical protein [Polyangiales bacterium]
MPWLAFTLVLALGADALCTYVLIPRGTTGRIQRLLRSDDPDEVGVFGSSRAEGNYVPDLLGAHVYDYGLSGTGFEVLAALLDLELAKPKRAPILINFDYDFFRSDLGDPTDYIPYYSQPAFRALMAQGGKDRLYFRVPGLRFVGTYEGYVKGFIESFGSPTKTFVRGAALNKSPLTREQFLQFAAQRRAMHESFSAPPAMDARFQAMLAQHRDRKVVLVVAPYHRSVYDSVTNFSELRAYLSRLEQTHSNVITLYFDGSTLADDEFYDTSHLNEAGARKFSLQLKQQLAERGVQL